MAINSAAVSAFLFEFVCLSVCVCLLQIATTTTSTTGRHNLCKRQSSASASFRFVGGAVVCLSVLLTRLPIASRCLVCASERNNRQRASVPASADTARHSRRIGRQRRRRRSDRMDVRSGDGRAHAPPSYGGYWPVFAAARRRRRLVFDYRTRSSRSVLAFAIARPLRLCATLSVCVVCALKTGPASTHSLTSQPTNSLTQATQSHLEPSACLFTLNLLTEPPNHHHNTTLLAT